MPKRFDRCAPFAFRRLLLSSCGIAVAASVSTVVWAQTAPAPAPVTAAAAATATPPETPWAPPASFGEWAGGIKFTGQAEAGIVVNTHDPSNQENFGQLFTDKSNRPVFNQLLLTLERDTDPKATDYDFGFKLQGMYGSDARIIHTLGVFDHAIHDRNQIDVVEANVSAHTPWLSDGGMDFKGGIYPTPLGLRSDQPLAQPVLLPLLHLQLRTAVQASRRCSPPGTPPPCSTSIWASTPEPTHRSAHPAATITAGPAASSALASTFMGGDLTILALSHVGTRGQHPEHQHSAIAPCAISTTSS